MRVSSSCGRIVAPKVGSLFALVIVLIECGKSLAFLPVAVVAGCFSIRHCSGVHDASVTLVRRIESRRTNQVGEINKTPRWYCVSKPSFFLFATIVQAICR